MKTKEVFAIEKQLGFVLHETPLHKISAEWHQAYSLDESGNLVALSLTLSKQDDISFLQDLTHLEKLFLRISGAIEVEFVRSEMVLHKRYLDKYTLDLPFLNALPHLHELGVEFSCIENSEELVVLQNLQKLSIAYSEIKDVDFLAKAQMVESIALDYNVISGKVLLCNLPNLRTITLRGNKIEALHLHNLPALTKIDIQDNPLTPFTISQCDNLQTIRIKDTKLENLTLENLPALTSLSIENTPLQKIHMDKSFALETLELVDCGVSNMDRRLLLAEFEKIATLIGYDDLEERLSVMREEFEKNNSIVYRHTGKMTNFFTNFKIAKFLVSEINKKNPKDIYYLVSASLFIVSCKKDTLTIPPFLHIKSFDFSALKHLDLSKSKLIDINFLRGLSNLETLSLNYIQGLELDVEILESLPNLRVLNVKGVSGEILGNNAIPYEIAERGKEAVIAFLKQKEN